MAATLSEQQIREFKGQLKQRFIQLRSDIREQLLESDEEQHIDLAGRVHDAEEESVANLLVDLTLSEIDQHVREIREIDAALLRIATGDYGTCIDCDEPIQLERLRAYPTAARCRDCQARHERTYYQEGHPTL